MARNRFAVALATLVLPLLLSGCGPMRLHILIPDFATKSVDGLRLYRVGQGGKLADAGYIAFGSMVLTPDGLQLQYTQYTPENTVWGPLMVPMVLPAPGRFSMTSCWPSRSDNHCPMSRAVMSVPPPGGNPTTKRTGRVG